MPANEAISVTGRKGNWYAFTHQGQPAFIYSGLVAKAPDTAHKDPVVALATDAHNARVAKETQNRRIARDLDSLEGLLS